jgi:cation transport ATPase
MQLALMLLGAAFVGSLPLSALAAVIGRSDEDPEAAAALGALFVPILLLLVCYAVILSVLNQLALHSLAHNRRGVYSALLHGWRIMRNDGWATARGVLVDLLLLVTVAVVWMVISGFGQLFGHPGRAIAAILGVVLLYGFAGVARAGYWARAYRALGGLSADDGVPGL